VSTEPRDGWKRISEGFDSTVEAYDNHPEPRDEYTPTTDEVRAEYVTNRAIRVPTTTPVASEFDRWLAAHDREVAAAALDKAADEFRSGQITGLFTGRDQYPREWLRQRADKIREGRTDA
jgi:hypothetical protein